MAIVCSGCAWNKRIDAPAVHFYWGMASYYDPGNHEDLEVLVPVCAECAATWADRIACMHEPEGSREEYLAQEERLSGKPWRAMRHETYEYTEHGAILRLRHV